MVGTEIVIGIIVLTLLLLTNLLPGMGKVVGRFALLGILFLFALAQFSDSKQGVFYSILLLFGIVMSIIADIKPEPSAGGVVGFSFSGVGFLLVNILLGFGLFILIRSLTAQSGTASILGVPLLAVSPGFESAFAPTLTASLGFIENLAFINLHKINKLFVIPVLVGLTGLPSILWIILSIVLVAGLFAIFHGFLGVSFSLFAFSVFVIWLIVSETPLGSESTNISHFLWNFSLTLQRTLSFL